jgi:hypothetical protein
VRFAEEIQEAEARQARLKVRAIDRAGNVDPTPAKRKFTILK